MPLAPFYLFTEEFILLFSYHISVDHTMGIITLLANILRGGAGTPQPPRTKAVCPLATPLPSNLTDAL